MYKYASPPLLTGSTKYKDVQVSGPGHFKGSSPVLDWNDQYNDNTPLLLKDSSIVDENYIIKYYVTPFNYIELDSSTPSSQILQIDNCPPCWWYIRNRSNFSVIISPQINGTESYDSTNEYSIDPNSHRLLCITPGSPPLINPLQNPTSMNLI